MTLDELIAEGRRLQRSAVLLTPEGTGTAAAVWYERDADEIEQIGYRRWLSFDLSTVPGSELPGIMTVFTDEKECEGGRVEIGAEWPTRPGTPLYSKQVSVLPPIDAVFARGSDAVGGWLQANGWEREWPYNPNFKDDKLARSYMEREQAEHPLYTDSAYAMLGGWHVGWPDDDWHDLIDDQLLCHTFRDSEPWVEVWRLRNGDFRVIQRIT